MNVNLWMPLGTTAFTSMVFSNFSNASAHPISSAIHLAFPSNGRTAWNVVHISRVDDSVPPRITCICLQRWKMVQER